MDETRLQSSAWLNTPICFSRGGSGPLETPSGICMSTGSDIALKLKRVRIALLINDMLGRLSWEMVALQWRK